MRTRTSRQRGFVLIAFTLALLLILAAVGLSFDIGRMYITRNESQSYCDAAAIAAALKLDGTTDGIANARNAAFATVKGWQFGTKPFNNDTANIAVTFSTSLADPFVETPADPTGYSCARVTVTNVRLPMALMPVVTSTFAANISATATAKQLHVTGTPEGVFPFSPYRHPVPYSPDSPTATGCDPNCTAPGYVISKDGTYATRTAVPLAADAALWNGNPIPGYSGPTEANPPSPEDTFGMIPAVYKDASGDTRLRHGGLYTLQWISKPLSDPPDVVDLNKGRVCPGDYSGLSAAIGQADGEYRGYIWKGDGTSVIVDKILHSSTGGVEVSVGEILQPTTGDKEAITKAINERVAMDVDTTSRWYIDYLQNRRENLKIPDGLNEYRVVTVPINTGKCGPVAGGTYTNEPCPASYQVVEFGSFFLQTSYDMGGNKAICAEYIGKSSLQGRPGAPGPGVYVVRLVQ